MDLQGSVTLPCFVCSAERVCLNLIKAIVLDKVHGLFAGGVDKGNPCGPFPLLTHLMKQGKGVGNCWTLGKIAEPAGGALIAVITGYKIGQGAFGKQHRVVAYQRKAFAFFAITDTGFDNQRPAAGVGQHGLHGGVCGISDGLTF